MSGQAVVTIMDVLRVAPRPLGRITGSSRPPLGEYINALALEPLPRRTLASLSEKDAYPLSARPAGLVRHCRSFLFQAYYWHTSREPNQDLGAKMPIDTGGCRVIGPRAECRCPHSGLRQKSLSSTPVCEGP